MSKENLLANKRRWRANHPEAEKEQSKRWRENNPEKSKEASRLWRQRNPEQSREIGRRYREQNPEKVKECIRKYTEQHPEKVREKRRRRRAQESNTIISLTIEQEQKILAAGCFFCGAKENLAIAHDKPVSKGGNTTQGNCFCLCQSCNSKMRTKTLAQKIKQLLFDW